MSMRLHELAKEIGAESKVLLALAKELGLKKVRNHSSSLADGEMAILKAAYREAQAGEEAATEAEPPRKKAKKKTGAAPRRRRKKTSTTEPDAEDVETAPAEAPEIGDEPASEVVSEAAEPATAAPSAGPADESDAGVEPEPATQGVSGDSGEPAEVAPAASGSESADQGAPSEGEPVRVERPAARRREPDMDAHPDTGARPSPARKPPLRPAVSTGKPPQTPTPRRRSGAKILGRIELPQEEINRARTRPHPGPSTDPDVPHVDRGPHDRSGRPGSGAPTRDTIDHKMRRGSRPKEDVLSWSPDDEDDPLLQGIRVRHVQQGPHTRRPPRRVGPRKARRAPPPTPTGPVDVECPISIRDLSQALGVKANDILRILMGKGVVAHVNMALDEEGVLEVASALNREVNTSAAKGKEESFLEEVQELEKKLAQNSGGGHSEPRAPIVAFLGHVDHGKTSLLDYIRKTNVAAGEAGGITQSMRAYSVTSPTGGKITFLDTPGHKAFTEMRARGAHVTDIVVLVVAADDGVMPQTKEAIQHAKAAGCPMVVALNKCDRVEANPDRVLQQLAHEGVMVEGWGGDIQVARCSAITGEGIDDLLEKISLQAEIMELRADPNRQAVGTVIEAYKDDQLGPVATVLVQEGTLRVGDVVLAGTAYGRVRRLDDDQGRSVEEAGPSTPVNIIGLNGAPAASERFFVVEDLKKAREVAEEREEALRKQRVSGPARATVTLENLFASMEAGKTKELKIVLRCDVQGSLEVVKRSLQELETKEVRVRVIRDALGGITEDDVLLALASEAIVIGFNVVPDEKARSTAEEKGIDVRTYQVIYELIDEVKAAMEGLLSPVKKEKVVGHVEIREVFKVSRIGSIAGCRVLDGVVRRNSTIRLTRDGVILHTGTLDSLRRVKDDVREVKEGLECGLHIAGYDDIKVGDIIEVIEVAEERRTLEFEES